MQTEIKTGSSVFCAYYTEWNRNTYTRTEPFCERPFAMPAGSTGGAPVVCGESFLAGLLRECDAVFEWNGSELKIQAPEGAVFVSSAETAGERWAQYHEKLNIGLRRPVFGRLPEYCTWVEQIRICPTGRADDAMEVLTEDLIGQYLYTIKKDDLPPGRFTIDAGWSPVEGPGGFGDWVPRDEMRMKQLAEYIASEGHVPGLWMAPSLIHAQSERAGKFPELLGPAVDMGGECLWSRFRYTRPCARSQEMICDLFEKAFEWGFRKFKLDVFYGSKTDMRLISEQCRKAAGNLPEPVELEGHIPDPFCAQYMDVIRINDLLISEKHSDWRNVFNAHLNVCQLSAPGMMLNLDHIGGNSTAVSEELFIQHLHEVMTHRDDGYPCISLLPNSVGNQAVQVLQHALKAYEGECNVL